MPSNDLSLQYNNITAAPFKYYKHFSYCWTIADLDKVYNPMAYAYSEIITAMLSELKAFLGFASLK